MKKEEGRIAEFIRSGEMSVDRIATVEDLLEQAGRRLDKACSHDICGEVVFKAANGKYYTLTVEAVISEANPEYVADLLEEDDDEDDNNDA